MGKGVITYEEAKAIALKANKRVDTCREFEEAYHFYEKEDDSVGGFGVVVLKESGRAIQWTTFLLDYNPEKFPKEIKF